jgi:hypothetical protein
MRAAPPLGAAPAAGRRSAAPTLAGQGPAAGSLARHQAADSETLADAVLADLLRPAASPTTPPWSSCAYDPARHLREHPGLRAEHFRGDFERDLGAIPAAGPRLIAFLCSTVGNLEPLARGAILALHRPGAMPAMAVCQSPSLANRTHAA